MKKILVTTDFSTNSKAGIRFAIQLASQTAAHLVFYHVLQELRPTSWSQDKYNEYATNELERHQKMLQKFIDPLCQKYTLPLTDYTCVTETATDVVGHIISYAENIKADFICMSTRGAGTIEKFFGTNASTLITSSSIPVIVVPPTYRLNKNEKMNFKIFIISLLWLTSRANAQVVSLENIKETVFNPLL